VQIGKKLRPVGWPRKRKKGGRRKSQNRYILPPRGDAISQLFVDPTMVITLAKFGIKIFIVFSRPFRNYITVTRATALACDYAQQWLIDIVGGFSFVFLRGWRCYDGNVCKLS